MIINIYVKNIMVYPYSLRFQGIILQIILLTNTNTITKLNDILKPLMKIFVENNKYPLVVCILEFV